jgi:hypothetical protein
MAVGAGVPICCSFLDFKRRRGGIGPTFVPSGDVRADMNLIRAFYADIEPKYPAQKSTIYLDLEDEVEMVASSPIDSVRAAS